MCGQFFERSFLCAAPSLWNKLSTLECLNLTSLNPESKLNFIQSILKHNNNVIKLSIYDLDYYLLSLLSVVYFIFHFRFDNMFVQFLLSHIIDWYWANLSYFQFLFDQ